MTTLQWSFARSQAATIRLLEIKWSFHERGSAVILAHHWKNVAAPSRIGFHKSQNVVPKIAFGRKVIGVAKEIESISRSRKSHADSILVLQKSNGPLFVMTDE